MLPRKQRRGSTAGRSAEAGQLLYDRESVLFVPAGPPPSPLPSRIGRQPEQDGIAACRVMRMMLPSLHPLICFEAGGLYELSALLCIPRPGVRRPVGTS